MDWIKRLEPVWLALVMIGALNWGIVGLFDTNVLEEIFGTGTLVDIVYVIVGVAGLCMLPWLLEDLHLGSRRVRPTGA
jgi:uncharacterized protein